MIMKKEDFTHLPNHVAIIMDGNGRWAKKIGKKRAFGHENGTKSVRDCIDQSLRLGIKNLTLYVFSTENWNRPKFEVNALMDLLVYSLENERVNLIENGIKLNVIGELETLKDKAKTKLKSIISETKSNKKLNLNLAISYGSKQEIVNVIREISNKVKNNIISSKNIDENIINEHLYTRNLPNVDLLIRTGGEKRISNFLLWQIAYAEMYFTDLLWPDFKKEDFIDALDDYQKRDRRFGKIN
ncbi:isoprenyl transferase [Flavobacteriaceae bacterium]|jgi:undecaprenyl diphosphate synthase|nr:isoprenyl transferase [Flavobacteriaceae bacterium]MBT4297231.1 isoprenyl transferase [Flavobacteriaceae bacterium]MBT5232516.1 isoprenyl transferase [Flavobacteriaceae bacterium]MBT5493982.1 isoprenyl transferase [Flavobacteriaceae bacterium]MBT6654345.1 isoprenyl transferase [Flavobacteriaceae bacterium]